MHKTLLAIFFFIVSINQYWLLVLLVAFFCFLRGYRILSLTMGLFICLMLAQTILGFIILCMAIFGYLYAVFIQIKLEVITV